MGSQIGSLIGFLKNKMEKLLIVAQIVLGILLALGILLQEKGSGLGEAIAGSSAQNVQTTKRGAERVLAQLTVLILVLFLAASLALNFI